MSQLMRSLQKFLEYDERVVHPLDLKDCPDIYKSIKNWVWVVKYLGENTLMWENKYFFERLDRGDIVALERYAIAQIRELPEDGRSRGDIINGETYRSNPDLYTVLDSFVVVSERNSYNDTALQLISVNEYQRNYNLYHIIDTGFVVSSKPF